MSQHIRTVIILVILATLGFGVAWELATPNVPSGEITNFEECISAGNPAMESYPRQCRHGKKMFTEIITETFTETKGPVNYSIDVPLDWYPHENGPSVLFSEERELNIPLNTDGFAMGPNFSISVSNISDISGVTSYDEWLAKSGMTEASDLFISKENVTVNGLSMMRILLESAGVAGEVMHYVYFADTQRVITLTQFPYEVNSNTTSVFERAVQTFRVPQRQNDEGSVSPLSLDEALVIARDSRGCSNVGVLTDSSFYNENSQTWWVDLERTLDLEIDGCHPACVVSAETKSAEVNWRCTGAIPPTSTTPPISTPPPTPTTTDPEPAAINCLPEQRNVDACIALYQPVCATVEIQCITTPCNPIQETFSNSCNACSNQLVRSYVEGACE